MNEHLSLKEIQEQIAKLQAQQQKILSERKSEILAEIKSQISEYGLTQSDIFGNAKKSGTKKPKMIRYYDRQNGISWAGRGRKPPEFENLSQEELEQFRLDPPVAADLLD
jgi:DNA-binding protein H-NS